MSDIAEQPAMNLSENVVAVLTNMRDRFKAGPESWVQCYRRRGHAVCLVEALDNGLNDCRITGDDFTNTRRDARNFLTAVVGTPDLVWWNDYFDRKHSEVLTATEKALALAQAAKEVQEAVNE